MARQHGVAGLDQITALGISASAVYQRAACGRLLRVHRAVYSLVPPTLLSRDGRYLAAVLACGPGAVLSHRSAADLLALRATSRTRIEVTVPGRARRAHAGVQVHRSTLRADQDVTVVRGIPVTTVSRTLLDLAHVVRPRELERAVDQAEITHRLNQTALDDQLRRNNGRPGAPRLRALIEREYGPPALTRSELEERFLALCRHRRLPAPEVNALVALPDGGPPLRVDFLWRAQRLVVETDGRETHGTAFAFEDDRRRDQRATLAGWRVVRVTWGQVTDEPDVVARLVADLLAATPQ